MSNGTDERTALKDDIRSRLRTKLIGRRAWSFALNVTLFGAAIISVAVGFIVQHKAQILGFSNESLSTTLAFMAAVLSTMAATGRFEQKWRANRLTYESLEELQIDLLNSDADLVKARERLKTILRMHNEEIMGGVRHAWPGNGADTETITGTTRGDQK